MGLPSLKMGFSLPRKNPTVGSGAGILGYLTIKLSFCQLQDIEFYKFRPFLREESRK